MGREEAFFKATAVAVNQRGKNSVVGVCLSRLFTNSSKTVFYISITPSLCLLVLE